MTDTFGHVAELILTTCPSCQGQAQHRPGCKTPDLSLKLPAEVISLEDRRDAIAATDPLQDARLRLVEELRSLARKNDRVGDLLEELADMEPDDNLADQYIDLVDEIDELATKLRQLSITLGEK